MKWHLDWIGSSKKLDGLKEAGLYNRIRTLSSPQGAWLVVDGKRVLNFCSNNYLGLANHPRLVQARETGHGAIRRADRRQCAPSPARMDLHLELERRLAAFKGVEAAITFQSGFTANLASHPGPGRQGGRDLLRRAEPRQHHRRLPPFRGAHRALRPRRPG